MIGKTITGQPLVSEVTDDIKMPTGEVGDLTISVAQLKAFIRLGLSAVDHTHLSGDIEDLADILLGKANANHGHSMEDILNLLETLNNKSNIDHLHEIINVTGLNEALTALMQLIETHTGNTNNPHNTTKAQLNLGSVDNTADMDKPVSNPQQAAFDLKLTEVITPSAAVGEALTMTKSGTNGRLKKLIAGQDTSLSSTGDTVTFATVGRTLKDFTESSPVLNTKQYRQIMPNVLGSSTIHLRLGGRLGTGGGDANFFSVAITDPDSTFGNVNVGFGSVDLQVSRLATAQCASGIHSFAAGRNNTVSAGTSVVLAENVAVNNISGSGTIALIGGGANAATVSGQNNTILAGGGTYSGSSNAVLGAAILDNSAVGNSNVLLGAGHGISGNNSAALRGGGSSLSGADGRGMSNIELRSTSAGTGTTFPIAQAIRGMYSLVKDVASAGTWQSLTSNRLAVGTTNIYFKVACFFSGYIRCRINLNQRWFRIEGFCDGASTLNFTATLVGGNSVNVDDGEVQAVISGNYILFQARHGAAPTTAVGVNPNEFRADAIIDFYEVG